MRYYNYTEFINENNDNTLNFKSNLETLSNGEKVKRYRLV